MFSKYSIQNELKGCQNKLRMTKRRKLRTSKLNKDLSTIECFQCCLSIENSNGVF